MNKILNNVLNNINKRLERLKLPLAEVRALSKPDFDGFISCFGRNRAIEIKHNLTIGRFPRLESQLQKHNAILFTEYISPALAECLQKSDLEYADLAGNMFLKSGGNCILVENCAKPQILEADLAHGRAMTPTGLKVLFLLLTQPEAVTWNYRRISEYAGVSLGSVKYVMTDLLKKKWLIDIQGKLRFQDIQQLYEKWTNAYVEKLSGKYDVMRFQGELDYKDKELLGKYPIALTGEAAAGYLNLLVPASFCLYQWGNINELIARKRWTHDENGNIEIRRTFWPELRTFRPLVPHLLMYADLIAENDGRCLETAKTIYEKYLNGKV